MNFEKEILFVKNYLIDHHGEESRRSAETFRKRSEHSFRVYKWCQRIINESKENLHLDLMALYLAAIFHDVGYGSEYYKNSHAIEGAEIFKNYADANSLDLKLTDKVYYLIYNHSNKELLKNPNSISKELCILMEADWLDEEGAMSICWDSNTLKEPSCYEDFLEKIKKYSAHILAINPMVTDSARIFWKNKQEFVKDFIEELSYELFIEKRQ